MGNQGTRLAVVTGSASGIGLATANLLRNRGHDVIGVDLRDCDVVADLSSEEGCAAMVRAVTERTQRIDVVIANAGVTVPDALCYALNYHGAIRTLEGLKPLLERSQAPRAIVTASFAASSPHDDDVIEILESGGTPTSEGEYGRGYINSKYAIARWVRRAATGSDWAGRRILLNAVCPGLVATPMQAEAVNQPSVQQLMQAIPLARTAEPSELAEVFAFLASEANRYVTGQVLYVDGGLDARFRPDLI